MFACTTLFALSADRSNSQSDFCGKGPLFLERVTYICTRTVQMVVRYGPVLRCGNHMCCVYVTLRCVLSVNRPLWKIAIGQVSSHVCHLPIYQISVDHFSSYDRSACLHPIHPTPAFYMCLYSINYQWHDNLLSQLQLLVIQVSGFLSSKQISHISNR